MKNTAVTVVEPHSQTNKDVSFESSNESGHRTFFFIQLVLFALLIMGIWVLMNNGGPVGNVEEFVGGLR